MSPQGHWGMGWGWGADSPGERKKQAGLSPPPSSVLSPSSAPHLSHPSTACGGQQERGTCSPPVNGHWCPPGQAELHTSFIPHSGQRCCSHGEGRDLLQPGHCRCLPDPSFLHKPCFHSGLPLKILHSSHCSKGQFMGPACSSSCSQTQASQAQRPELRTTWHHLAGTEESPEREALTSGHKVSKTL